MTFSRRATLGLSAGLIALLAAGHASAADYTLRLHTLVKSPHPYNDMAQAFKTQVEAKSNGAIEVKIFDSGQLGKDPAVIGELGFGTVDMMISSVSNAAQNVPEYGIFTMPYLFNSMDAAVVKIEPGTPVSKHFQEVYEERGVGMKLLALGASGTRNMSTTEVTIESPADLKGLKMRTPPSPMDSKTWSAFGMQPVTVAWGELYAAMQTGVAQAMESSLPGYNGSKLYEVAPNLALTQHTIQINHTSISQRSWDKLPEELQLIVSEAAVAANALGVEKAKGYDAALVDSLKTDHGVSVSTPDKAAFIEVVAPLQVKLAEELDLVEEYKLLTE